VRGGKNPALNGRASIKHIPAFAGEEYKRVQQAAPLRPDPMPAKAGACTFKALPFRAGFLLALLSSGCAPHPTTSVVQNAPNPKLAMTLEMTPRPVTSLDPTIFNVRLHDASGKPVSGAKVQISLAMPAMPMGDNTQTLRETREGEYGGTGRFTMAGAWRVTVTAASGSEQTAQTFPQSVR
jgi:hypothetical protein